jgi:CO/xanthine dehydrogenase FAD-binding subunit
MYPERRVGFDGGRTRQPGQLPPGSQQHPPRRNGARAARRARSADDFPAVSVAAAVASEPDGTVRSARIALGAVGSTAMLADEAAGLLAGR